MVMFHGLRWGRADLCDKDVASPVWSGPLGVTGVSLDPCQDCVCPFRAPRTGLGSPQKRAPEGRPIKGPNVGDPCRTGYKP